MNKHEAAEFLGVSTKSVERYATAGKLKVVYIEKKAVFDEQEVQQLKEEKEAPVHRALPVPATETRDTLSVSVAGEERVLSNILQFLQILLEQKKFEQQQTRLTLSLEEAVIYSGFSKRALLGAIKSGALVARKIGGRWRLRRIDLTTFVNEYFTGNLGVNGREPRESATLPNHVPE